MRILGVRLRNIRSYVDKIIVFPPSGTTVIYGDNGTGKTSILLGINYALFGLPRGQRGSDPFAGFVSPYKNDLLRVGTSSAMVRVLIRHKGKLILIERRLNGDRGGKIVVFRDTDSKFSVESSNNYSSEDLTEKILDILGLREDPKKSRSTYIFSNVMYVPQFNIHQTLVLDDKQRRELIDRVLGLDKYMTVLNNIEKIAKGKNSVIGSELYSIDRAIEDRKKILEKINVGEVRTKLNELRSKRSELDKELSKLRELRESLEKEREKLSSVMNEASFKIGKLRSEINIIKKKEEELKEKKEKLDKILSSIGLSKVSDITGFSADLKKLKSSLESEYSYVSKELEELDEKLRSIENNERKVLEYKFSLEAEIKNIKNKVREIWAEITKMKDLVTQGVCPLCKQPIKHEHGEELIRRKSEEMRDVAIEIVPLIKDLWSKKSLLLGLSREKEEISKKKIELSKHQDEVLKKLREIDADILRLSQATDLNEEILKLEKEVLEKTKVLEELNVAEVEYRKLREETEKLNTELSEVKKKEVELSKELGEVSEQIRSLEKKLEEYSELSDELRKLELRASLLAKIRDYLVNHIYKGVEAIESNVRGFAHGMFREYFREYFVRLLENQEVVEASVSDFKPVVMVRASVLKEQEISQPSGAQLTALGLAYRLALNRVVRDLNKELRDSVLIMDEPTLGFSPERVEKLRELMESIGSNLGDAQVILVTHDERLLEVGDCKIRLSIDYSRNETMIDYEECFIKGEDLNFQQYKNIVSNILSRTA